MDDISRVLKVAYDQTEFYRNKFDSAGIRPEDIRTWSDFRHVPTTDKEEIISAGSAAIVRGGRDSAFVSRSSGSSGTVLDVHQGGDFWIKDGVIGVRAYRRHVGLRAADRLLYVNTSQYPFRSVGKLLYRVNYYPNLQHASSLSNWISTHRPQVLMIYPSIADDLIRHVTAKGWKSGAPFRLKAIITHSEQSAQEFRNKLASFFCCPVYDEYATEELGRIALHCRFQTRHIIEEQTYVELLEPDSDTEVPAGTQGEIVGTCLVNTTMPFIRYRQGDLGSMIHTACECGITGRAFDDLLGRRNCDFHLPDGSVVASGRLLDWTYELILSRKLDIRHFQLVQHSHQQAEFRIVPGPQYLLGRDCEVIRSSFTQILTPHMSLHVTPVPEIERTQAGKHIAIRSAVAMRSRTADHTRIGA
ncbi:hypothetical protein DMH18_26495 [Streptomyces sp. WAC 06783]|uniref:phenylacetate--CoA ligase family protein n=1 Tax=Streptomyces sp. WAC 06783 TaxID=2203211 RepID=UPI000F73F678|nr:phenylacetate--CoA ligase family protein [Streptomyces sp. WAC 06783]RSO06995.1 hypothetical protein DMH18_26495 [Streptomyces sp. WAC 06783]